mmetsp:Transcript_4580/g.11412  ORF Transcript_4580/g.11412 Transcript_4580/m.11412 type:complete len:258 (-) Transcript_4580:519-1292(-)
MVRADGSFHFLLSSPTSFMDKSHIFAALASSITSSEKEFSKTSPPEPPAPATSQSTLPFFLVCFNAPTCCALPFHDQYTPDLEHCGSEITWAKRSPASSSETYPPVTYFMKTGKSLRNHSRFSRNKLVSAMQPGYMEEKVMPVSLWRRLCSSRTVIMLRTFESLYALAPSNLAPFTIVYPGFSNPERSPRSARGYTNPPPIVLVLPVMEPTMQTRGFFAFFMSSSSRLTRRKWPRWLTPRDISKPSSVKRGVGSAGR